MSGLIKILLCCLLLMIGCVEKTDLEEGRNERIVSIAHLKTFYKGAPCQITQSVDIKGVVTANDEFGTFASSLVIEDETAAIEIKVSAKELWITYPLGSSVVVRCGMLTLGAYSGVVQLGEKSADGRYETDFITADNVPNRIVSRPASGQLVPRALKISEITTRDVSRLVSIDGVQFIDKELSLAWCDQDSDTDRHLVDSKGDTLIVRTSRKAVFAGNKLPSGNGRIEGVMGYFNKKFQLRVVSPLDVYMTRPRIIVPDK